MVDGVFSISKIRVRYADTDQMRIVYYGKYFEYFEEGRSDFFRLIELSYSEIEKNGIALPVVEAKASYKKPAKYDDLLEVKTILSELPMARIKLNYEIRIDGSQKIIAEGFTEHAFIDLKNNKTTRAPKSLLDTLKKYFK